MRHAYAGGSRMRHAYRRSDRNGVQHVVAGTRLDGEVVVYSFACRAEDAVTRTGPRASTCDRCRTVLPDNQPLTLA